jgi:IclR family transcriptional regulator, acetate operon repressor
VLHGIVGPMNDIQEKVAKADKPRVQSAARVVEILQLVAQSDSDGISARDISTRLKLPRQVVYHLAHTLVATDMLRKSGGNNYVLGLGVAALAQSFRRQMAAPASVGTYAERASAMTGETAYVVGWTDDDIVVLVSARGSAAIQAAEVPRGTAGDAHARASGKLLLAMAPNHEVERYLAGHAFTARTPNTIVTRAAFDTELDRIRTNWVSTEIQEYALGLSCMAVPIGKVPSQMVLGISAPSERFLERRDDYVEMLKDIAST